MSHSIMNIYCDYFQEYRKTFLRVHTDTQQNTWFISKNKQSWIWIHYWNAKIHSKIVSTSL